MGRSLEATHYTDGKAITLKKDFTTTAGYYTGKFKDAPQDFYFYNSEAVISGKLSPQGWSIPTETEWELLKQYINNDASKLKFGPWSSDEMVTSFPY
ncbi:fibrobacter succinogenes major domain family protein [Bacteroides fragilis str. B1 (UDC16-1)]|nr:fibrobacter succinogenes major domain family protein [Bacteroides fragilis str. B1 (UDC16-1)]